MDDKVTLLSIWPSPYGQRVQIALAEKGIDYEYKEDNVYDKSPLLLEMNPVHKKVPVLIHNGKPICESLIIVQYIDEVWNDRCPLLPSDPYQRAQAKFWADYVDKMYSHARKIFAAKGEEQESGKKEFLEGLKTLEAELGDKKFFGGETFGFLDLALITSSCWFYTLGFYGNFSVEAVSPKLVDWGKRCMERESVSKSLPDPHKLHDFVQQFRKKQGLE